MITIPNSYFLFLQKKIISSIRNCYYITIVNAINFLYQWFVVMKNRYKFTVIKHQKQEYFNVIFMKFKNFSFYIQRQMNYISKKFCVFCRIYIDDIVIFSIILKNHVKHFSVVFNKFQKLDIILNFNKIYIGYPLVILFEKK